MNQEQIDKVAEKALELANVPDANLEACVLLKDCVFTIKELQSRIAELEKDAERFRKLAAHMTFSLDGDYVTMDFSCPVDATKTHDVHDDWIEPRFTDSVRRTVDTAIQSEKGGV